MYNNYACVVGVMKIGNAPRVGIEPTSLAFQARLLTISSPRHPDQPYPCLPVYVAPCLRCQCRLQHSPRWNCKCVNAYNYIHTGNDFTYAYTG